MQSNDELIEGFLRGDSNILDSIYKRTFSAVLAYVIAHDGSKKDAEDIFHNALLTLYVKLKKQGLDIQSFDNYLFIVCKNLWRRESAKKRVTNLEKLTLVSEDVDQASFYIEQDQWELYKEKFETLSNNCKEILRMVLNKIPYVQIVTHFNYASETVARQRVFKCKARLTQLIQKDKRYRHLKS